jgi:hypothetical protein
VTWLTERTDERRNIVHVTPNADLVDHDTDTFGACACGPRSEFCGGGWLFVHHALDGRE